MSEKNIKDSSMKIKDTIVDYLKKARIDEGKKILESKTGCEWEYVEPEELPDIDSYESLTSVFDSKQKQ